MTQTLHRKYKIWEEEPHSYGLNCEYFLDDSNRNHLLSFREEESPLEKSRFYGPFPADVLDWLLKLQRRNTPDTFNAAITLSVDADGREYLEY